MRTPRDIQLTGRSLALFVPLAVALGVACARPGGVREPAHELRGSVTFAIEVGPAVTGPVYVLLTAEDASVGWVRAFRGGQRVYLQERCAIADCGVEPAVCGAAIPMVRDIATGQAARRVEFVWDGLISVVDSIARCERRRPAPPGTYVARFCYARSAEFPRGRDSTSAVPGRLVDPTCVEKPFTPEDKEVVLRL